MKKLLLLVPIVLGLGMGKAEEKASDLEVQYTSPEIDIFWNGGDLMITCRGYEYDNPVSATPSKVNTSNSVQKISEETKLKLRNQINALLKEFFSLPASAGAPEGERCYPYTLKINVSGKTKEFTFRSNPSFPPAPEVFTKLEKLLLDLTK